MNKAIILTLEEWDRVVEILDYSFHPDKEHLLSKINTQIHYSPADEPLEDFLTKAGYPSLAKIVVKERNI